MAGLRIKLTAVANDARGRTVIKAKRKATVGGISSKRILQSSNSATKIVEEG